MYILFWGLQLVFITLKLLDKINWEWWLVLIPLEIAGGFVMLVLLLNLVWGVCHKSAMKDPSYAAQYRLKQLSEKLKR